MAQREQPKRKNGFRPRASTTPSPDLDNTIADLARRKKVSIARIVREHAGKYVANQRPLRASLKGA